VRRDLDDVRFVDVPWLVDPDAAAFANLPRAQLPNATLERLYALGVDAFRIAQAFESGPSARLEFDGATGHVWLDAARQFAREGRLMRFQAGEVVPADAR
jgi:outer membrane PBP1 activator LpoA protein